MNGSEPQPSSVRAHRAGLALLVLTVLGFFGPMLVRGEVVFPHDNAREVGLVRSEDQGRRSNRRFSDLSSVYLPEIDQHLRGRAHAWISTWNPHNELGRPTWQWFSGTRAYFATYLLSLVTQDALTVYTALVLVAVFLIALFGYSLLRALGLHWAACYAGASALSVGVLVSYWHTFVMFAWGVCWTLALLRCIEGALRTRGLGWGLGIAFAVNALFLAAYPQQVVWNLYIVVGFTLVRAWKHLPGVRARAAGLGRLAVFGALGIASSLPVYLDMARTAARSARGKPSFEFLAVTMPEIHGWRDVAFLLAQLADAWWIGDPIAESYPVQFGGASLTPLIAVLCCVSLALWRRRRLWPVHLFLLAMFLVAWSPPVYALGVRFGGLGISRFHPSVGAWIAFVAVAAVAADEVLRGRVSRATALSLAAACTAVTAVGFLAADLPLWPRGVAISLLLSAGTAVFLVVRHAALLVALSVATTVLYAFPLQLTRRPEHVHLSSRLVDMIRDGTSDGSRFAMVDSGYGYLLPSNQEVLLDLRSIHAYDSLSSRQYQDWTTTISARGTTMRGRYFRTITTPAPLAGDALGFAGIGLWISQEPLPPGVATPWRGVLQRPLAAPVLEAQLTTYEREASGEARVAGALAAAERAPVERLEGWDDLLRFRCTPLERESLLFVSQQHHPCWRARADGGALDVVRVNDFYLGVVLPPGTRQVAIEFRPYVVWAWLPLAFFGLAGAALGLRALRGAR